MFNQIRYLPIQEGRWLNDMDDAQKRPVIVLGDEARRTLFSGRPAVGSTILLNGVQFEVIGTLQRIGHGDNNNAKSEVLHAVQHDAGIFPSDSMWARRRM